MHSRIQRLDGTWLIAKDCANDGKENKWYIDIPIEQIKEISIPGVIQEAYPFYDGVAWYYYRFLLKADAFVEGRYLLEFGSVDYLCEVWLNGVYLGLHEDAEEPFRFDATESLLSEGENLLAVRVLNPYEEAIDGIAYEVTPHRHKVNLEFMPGVFYNFGGITRPVTITSVPFVRIDDVYVTPDWKTGEVSCEITVENASTETIVCDISLSIHEAELGRHVLKEHKQVRANPGKSIFHIVTIIADYRLWSTEDPFLYCADISLTNSQNQFEGSEKTVNFGYRDFRIQNGYFMLNGKRIFLKSAHTGNCLPVGGHTSRDRDLYMKDLLYAKSFGFNMVRFIAGIPFQEQLDMCDKIGLMVYEESFAGWYLEDSPRMKEYYERSVSNMIRRDRNHPCVTIWGFLNETFDGNVFRCAVDFLPKARKLDQSRLILLNSGRHDKDRKIGSAANPNISEWENHWGYDGVEGEVPVSEAFLFKSTSDIHTYPTIPVKASIIKDIRTAGNGNSKPVFIAEYGIGSQNNVIQEYLKFVENGERTDLEDALSYKYMADCLADDWEFFDLDGTYIFPEDFLLESMRLNSRQRQFVFDLIRSNPKICGYNLTGLLDQVVTGEGLWTYWREFKPGVADAVKEGWAPLRWALFSEKRCAYAKSPFRIEAVICNEDVLPPGTYPALFRIKGKNGIVWEKKKDIVLPEEGYAGMPPLALSVLNEEVCINEPGEYVFGATLLDGGAPLGGRLTINVFDLCGKEKLENSIAYCGLDDKSLDWLETHSVKAVDFEKEETDTDLIIVGNIESESCATHLWERLYQKASEGATVLFLCHEAFAKGEHTTANLPFGAAGKWEGSYNWLYHLDTIQKRHMVFDGIQDEGIVDFEYFDSVYPKGIFKGLKKPDKAICVTIGVGQTIKGGYTSGVTLGEYAFGKGTIVLNCFNIIEELGVNPIADRMLWNMLVCYSKKR